MLSLPYSILPKVYHSKGCEQCDFCLVERSIWCAYLNTYLPVAAHAEIANGAEMALVIGLEVDGVGPHIHVEHSGVERDAHIAVGLALAIQHTGGKGVGTETVG